MAETARELVEQMVAQRESPTPQLLDSIYRLGDESVEPLRDILRRAFGPSPDNEPVWFAFQLLCSLGAKAAIPDLIAVLRRYDPEDYEFEVSRMAFLGPEAIPPLLEMVTDESLDEYARSLARWAAVQAAVEHPSWRPRVATAVRPQLLELLTRYEAPHQRVEPSSADRDEAESLVWHLSELGDPQSRALLRRAVASGLVDADTPAEIGKQRGRAAGGHSQSESRRDPIGWLEEYRRFYVRSTDELHANRLDVLEEATELAVVAALANSGLLDAAGGGWSVPRVLGASPLGTASLGRNDQCWCGSGRKYKNCHLGSERAAA